MLQAKEQICSSIKCVYVLMALLEPGMGLIAQPVWKAECHMS